MLGVLVWLAMTIGTIWAVSWALTTLADLKRGQDRILRKLVALELAHERATRSPLPRKYDGLALQPDRGLAPPMITQELPAPQATGGTRRRHVEDQPDARNHATRGDGCP